MRQMPIIEEELADSVEVQRLREATHEVDDDQLRIETFVSQQREMEISHMTHQDQKAEGFLHTQTIQEADMDNMFDSILESNPRETVHEEIIQERETVVVDGTYSKKTFEPSDSGKSPFD